MSTASGCCPVCPTVESVSIPGVDGAAGASGASGSDGLNAFTVVAAPGYTIPALGGSVSIPTANSSWMSVGQPIFVQGGGYYTVTAKSSTSSITATFSNFSANSAFVGNVAAGATISASGSAGASLAGIAAFTDSSTGVASDTIAAGVGISTVALFVNLLDLANADLLTTYTPGYAFKILSVDFAVEKAVTTAAKLATLTPKISGVAVTGGVLSLTSANCTPQGVVVAGSAVTPPNTGTSAQTISITGSAVTAFVEGSGWILIRLRNVDITNALASIVAKINAIKAVFP